jgi:hypothetical protein
MEVCFMDSAMTSPAAQVIIAIIPIVGIVIGGTVVFFSLLWHHHEVKLQIKTGTYKRERFDVKTFTLLIGLLLTGVGLTLTIFFALLDGKSTSLLGGLIPLVIGVCLLIFFKLNPDFTAKDAE